MPNTPSPQTTVVRTSRGLSIAGTRLTLYDVMDYLAANWPPPLIQHWLNLTEQQMADVLEYISQHRAEVEKDYQCVVQQSEEIRQYWEAKNRERLAHIAALPPRPGHEALHAKLQAWKAKLKQT